MDAEDPSDLGDRRVGLAAGTLRAVWVAGLKPPTCRKAWEVQTAARTNRHTAPAGIGTARFGIAAW